MTSKRPVRAPDNSRQKPRRRGWRFRIAAVLLSVTLVLVVPELIVRAIGPTLRSYRAIRFGNDANSALLFEQDPELHWQLRADVDVEFMGVRVRTDSCGFRAGSAVPSEPTATLLCLGDSMPFGWGVEADLTYPEVLRRLLTDARPGEAWALHNAGVPGHSSHQLLLRARRQIPRLQPDIVVICVGTNDASPARKSDAQTFAEGGFTRLAVGLLGRSDFLTWAAEMLRGEADPPNPLYFERDAVSRVSVEEMLENLASVVRLAREHGTEPIILGPPSSLYLPPRNIGGALERWRPLAERSWQLLGAGQGAEALAAVEAALQQHADDIYLNWLRGMVAWLGVDSTAGRQMLVDLFERHPFPDRARPSCREQQRQLAASLNVPYVDPNELFRSGRSEQDTQMLLFEWHQSEKKLFFDWCHPSAGGHEIIAAQLARLVRR